MSGVTIPLLKKTRIERSYLGANASETLVIRKAIKVAPYYKVQLLARVHERNIPVTSTGKITLTLHHTLPSAEDPREFTITATPFLSFDVTQNLPTAVPGIRGDGIINADPSAYLKFSITATQHSVANTTLFAEISAVLLLREQ